MNKDTPRNIVVAINRIMVLALTEHRFDIFVRFAPHVQSVSVIMYPGHFSDDTPEWAEECYIDRHESLGKLADIENKIRKTIKKLVMSERKRLDAELMKDEVLVPAHVWEDDGKGLIREEEV